MGVGMKMKKVVIFPLKRCYRSICNHLFLVGFLFFLAFLYRSSPFIFSMLVSVSPVVVCTLVLLGALLSFGRPNVPEIELDNRETHELVLLKAAFLDDSVVVRNENVSMEKCNDKGKDMEEKSTERTSSIENDISRVGLDGSSGQSVEEISQDKEPDGRVHENWKKGFRALQFKNKSKASEERLADRRFEDTQYSLLAEDNSDDDEYLDQKNDGSLDGSVDSQEVHGDKFDSPPCSPWKHMDEEEGNEYDGDEALDSGSDGAESSCPDASMADITPVLDELHPLLDEDVSQPANLSHDGSDAYSELSVTSNESSSEMDDDTDEKEELKVGEDDEEELIVNKEDQTKCTITWTEEDQKNLMDLGTSELERNRRLENLIARRRARRCMTTVTERNLIDLDGTDPPFLVPPILTTRTNPFDSPQDSRDYKGHPPIPGSAPSILLPLKNPFDIPYDSCQEKPVPVEGSYQQEFIPPLPKDTFFRRHGSFNVQPSRGHQQEFMPPRPKDPFFRRHESFNVQPSRSYQQEFMPPRPKDPFSRRDDSFNVQPSCSNQEEFMPHQPKDPFFRRPDIFNVQPSCSNQEEFMPPRPKDPFFRRHDSFNVQPSCSYQEEFMPLQPKDPFFRRHDSFNVQPSSLGMNRSEKQGMSRYRPYFVSERLGSEGTNYTPIHRQSSEVSDSKASSVPDTESVSSTVDMEESDDTEEETFDIDDEDDTSSEPELMSKIDNAPELVGHGSESTEEEEDSLERGQVEKKQIKVDEIDVKLEDVDYHQETQLSSKGESRMRSQLEISSSDIHQNVEPLEHSYDGISHLSSLPEGSGSIYVEKEKERFHKFGEGRICTDEHCILSQQSPPDSHVNIATSLTDDATHKEPVYDSSPSSAFENRSLSSINFDPPVDSALDLSGILVKRSVSFSDRVTKLGSRYVDIDAIVDKDMLAYSSPKIPADKREMKLAGVSHITKHENPDDKGESESLASRDFNMINHNDIECDSAESSVNEIHVDGELDPLEKSEQKPSHNYHQGAFEPSVDLQEYAPEVSSVKRDSVSAAVSHAGITSEDRSAVDIPNEVDTFEDAGSDSGDSDVNAWEDTEVKTPDVSEPDISKKK
ncbi:hypothetical protein LIER_11364 [Lithospermum erythrorhizon]|uniref:Uncharacterized protein n=1 Tax=Lithospermum erythrorhizon TaxID=34254 RepID=A0AAV3PMR1_LITER